MKWFAKLLLQNRLALFAVLVMHTLLKRYDRWLIKHASAAEKDLSRPHGLDCPACGSTRIQTASKIPYFKTHLFKWNPRVSLYCKIVPPAYRYTVFEISNCTDCGLFYVPQTCKGLAEMVEEHPLYYERTVMPYLQTTQKPLGLARCQTMLSSLPAELDLYELKYVTLRSLIIPYLGKSGRLLDVGSNLGTFAEFMRLTCPAISVTGCEIGSRYLAESRRRYPELNVTGERLGTDGPNGDYDFIYCSNVIEHIWDLDSFIASLAHHLAPEGHLMLVTPDADCASAKMEGTGWSSFIVPHHVQFFTKNSLHRLMGRLGFAMVDGGSVINNVWGVYRRV